MLSPTETFNSVKDEAWGSSISYFAKWLIVWAIPITIILAALLVWIRGMFESWAGLYPEIDITQVTALFDLFAGPLVIGMNILAIISGLIGVLVVVLDTHLGLHLRHACAFRMRGGKFLISILREPKSLVDVNNQSSNSIEFLQKRGFKSSQRVPKH